jgi:hypothetical protein
MREIVPIQLSQQPVQDTLRLRIALYVVILIARDNRQPSRFVFKHCCRTEKR